MPDYEKWEFEKLLEEAKRAGVPGAERLERSHLVAHLDILKIHHAELIGLALMMSPCVSTPPSGCSRRCSGYPQKVQLMRMLFARSRGCSAASIS